MEKAKPKAASAKAVTDAWTVADFTYTEMEQTLNGCDYTRQIVIKGSAVAGFSESGRERNLSVLQRMHLENRDWKVLNFQQA